MNKSEAPQYEVELDERGYGKVHLAGCRDLRDPEPAGDDLLKSYAEIWPENEPWTEEEVLNPKNSFVAPCARQAYRAHKH